MITGRATNRDIHAVGDRSYADFTDRVDLVCVQRGTDDDSRDEQGNERSAAARVRSLVSSFPDLQEPHDHDDESSW